MQLAEIDPKGLIRESYRIGGVTRGECRSIFLDWAISVPSSADTLEHVRSLLGAYGAEHPAHPMTSTLQEALEKPAATGRRGGRKARLGSA
ncbi:MAG: hypothetical protein AAF841_06090 [Pseudomonadota bacterium]